MAGKSLILACNERTFWAAAVPTFIIFGTILSLLSGGLAAFNLFFATDLSGKLQILKDGFLGLFGVNKNLGDFLITFIVTIMQSILVGMIAIVWRVRKIARTTTKVTLKSAESNQAESTKSNQSQFSTHSETIQNAGLAAGLAILAGGCPTCGTTLMAPILGLIFSSSGYALAGVVSYGLDIMALLIMLWSFKKVGVDVYGIIITKKRLARRKNG